MSEENSSKLRIRVFASRKVYYEKTILMTADEWKNFKELDNYEAVDKLEDYFDGFDNVTSEDEIEDDFQAYVVDENNKVTHPLDEYGSDNEEDSDNEVTSV